MLFAILCSHPISSLFAAQLVKVLFPVSETYVCIQVIAQLELWNERKTGRYEHKVYVLPKHLDEKVAALHLPKLGAKLTKLTADQAKYINVPVTGPFKPAHYRY